VARVLEYLTEALKEAEALHRYPFSIIYRIEVERVLIVAVAHERRRPGYWKTRLPG
jgi:hypothetical protein